MSAEPLFYSFGAGIGLDFEQRVEWSDPDTGILEQCQSFFDDSIHQAAPAGMDDTDPFIIPQADGGTVGGADSEGDVVPGGPDTVTGSQVFTAG